METRLTRVRAGLGPRAAEITACWQRAEATWDLAMLALRAGTNPQALMWINYPVDSHPEEDLIDALRGGIRDAFPDGLAPRPSFTPVHASRLLG